MPRIIAAALSAALAVGVLAGCSTPQTPPASDSPGATGASATPATKTIEIVMKDGQVTPNGEKIAVAKGTLVQLKVTSDHDDAIHAHAFDAEQDVKAGVPATIEFTADKVGSFEIESHHPDKIIAILNVS